MHDQDYRRTNLARWNELVALHVQSRFYDVDGFRAGKCSLRPIETEELGDVAGKSLLHLQCHFGLDTLSWARRGARVTGVDFSDLAIAQARALAAETGVRGEFICADVYDLPHVLSGAFDIVFTSYGAICWLPDLCRWAEIAAGFLKPGGTYYMVELHPAADMLDVGPDGTPRVAYPYFGGPGPLRWEAPGSYADRTAAVRNTVSYSWSHGLGETVTALAGAGLTIEFLHEFPFCVCGVLPGMEPGPDGWWRLPGQADKIPFLYSLRARRPRAAGVHGTRP